MCDCQESQWPDTMGNVGKQQPPTGNIDPVTGQCVPGTFWNGVACVGLVDGGLPMPEPPIYIQDIDPIIDVPFEPVPRTVPFEPVYTPPVYDPGIIGKQQPIYLGPPVYVAPPIDDDPPFWEGFPTGTPYETSPPSQVCPDGYALVGGQCVRSTRPYEESPTTQTCPPGYTWHPVSGDCVPLQQGTDIISVTNEPTATPTNTTPTNTTTPTTPSASPLASLLDANGKLFGFDPMIVALTAAGVVLLLVIKD